MQHLDLPNDSDCAPSNRTVDANVSAPAMPLDTSQGRKHQLHKAAINSILDNLCVARPVGKADIARTPAARAAMQKEWRSLRSKDVCDESAPREWDVVRAEPQKTCYTVLNWHTCWYLCRRIQNLSG